MSYTKQELLNGMPYPIFLMRCRTDFKFFVENCIKETSSGEKFILYPFQKKWVDSAEKYKRIIIESGTGSAKTEIMGAAYTTWKIFCNDNINVLLLSKTRDQSTSNLLSRVKRYIENNAILSERLLPDNRSKCWNAEEIQTKNDCLVKNVTYSDTIRGFRAHIIVADEIDSYDDPNIFFEHVLSRLHPDAQLIGISTPDGPTKIIGQLKEKDKAGLLKGKWVFVKTPYLVDEDGNDAVIERREDILNYKSIWPEKWSVQTLYERWGEQGRANWMKNYMVKSLGEIDDAIFPIKYIEKAFDYKLGFSKNTNNDAMYFIGVDLAISEGAKADFDAYVVIEKLNGQYIIKWIQTEHGLDTIPKMDIIQNLYENFYTDSGTYIVVDKSMIGIDVIRGLQARGVPVKEGSFHSIARKQLYRTLSNVLASGRLIIPRNPDCEDECIKYSQELLEQLTGFRREVSQKSKNEMIASHARHDDIAAALALGISEAVEHEEFDGSPIIGNDYGEVDYNKISNGQYAN